MHARTTSFAFVVLFLVSQLGHRWHQASERHVRCVEHGEWVHAPADPGSKAGSLAEGSTAGARLGQGPSLLPAASLEDGHDHCELASLDRERTLARSPIFDFARVTGLPELARAPHEAPRTPAFPLHRLAPKQSPPC